MSYGRAAATTARRCAPYTAPMPLPRALEPFRLGRYRVLAFAMFVSVFGTGMWAVALVQHVIRLGGTAVDLSAVTAVGALGMVLFVLVGGIAADRYPLASLLRLVEFGNAATAGAVTVLSLTGTLQMWHLGAAAFVFAGGQGVFYPAILRSPPADPARPSAAGRQRDGGHRAAPPATGGGAGGGGRAHRPLGPRQRGGAHRPQPHRGPRPPAAVARARAQDAGVLCPEAGRRAAAGGGLAAVRDDLMEGVRYTLGTPWLLWAMLVVFLLMGPLEVLVPFIVLDRLDGDASTFGFLLAAYGAAGAVASLVTASVPMPRRYLSWMIGLWGLGTLPFGFVATTDSF